VRFFRFAGTEAPATVTAGPRSIMAAAGCDLVVIITRVKSHNAVRLARRLIRERHCAALFVPRFGVSRFESLIYQGFADVVQLSA
jgi:hypothetical protein